MFPGFDNKESEMKAIEDLADALESLFERDDRFTLVIEDDVRGEEGVYGLQLIANALCAARKALEMDDLKEACAEDEFEDYVSGKSGRSAFAIESEPRDPRLVRIARRITELSVTNSAHFILAYHISGTGAWRLAWSQDLQAWEAIDEMAAFVRCGLALDY